MATETNDNELVVRAQVPGIEPDEVKTSVEDGTVKVALEATERG